MLPTACWTTPSVPHFGHLFVGFVGAGSWTGMARQYYAPRRAVARARGAAAARRTPSIRLARRVARCKRSRMPQRVCPWWVGYLLVSPLRKAVQDPAALLAPLVHEGMTVLEPGPGMGFFTLEAARRVGPHGRVVAVDLQPKMIAALRRRAQRAGLADRIEARQARAEALGVEDLAGRVDLVLALNVVHELPDAGRFFAEVRPTLAPAGKVLVVEPAGHVKAEAFGETMAAAARAGLRRSPGPRMWRSLTAVLDAAERGSVAAA